MDALTSALSVIIKLVRYKCFAWPTIMLGVDPNGDPQPIGVTGSGGGIPITPPTGTLTMVAAVASSTTTIPAGAFNIGILILTGTGTVNGVDLPANVPLNIADKTAASIAVVLANPGSARISYLS